MCPPGVDQTTRTSPRWNLLAPELKQCQKLSARPPLPLDQCQRPDHIFFSRAMERTDPKDLILKGLSWNAFDRLARVDDLQTSLLPAALSGTNNTTNKPSSSLLERKMPAELLGMIIAHLADEDAEMALALCSRTLWCAVLGSIQTAMRLQTHAHGTATAKRQTSWAGTPILCTSTWLTDLPPAIMNMPANRQLREDCDAWASRVRRAGHPSRGMAPARRWNYDTLGSCARAPAADAETDPARRYLRALEKHAKAAGTGLTDEGRTGLRRALRGVLYPQRDARRGTEWTLRNLDTREIVRLRMTRRPGSTTGGDAEDDEEEVVRVAAALDADVASRCAGLSVDSVLAMRINWGPLARLESEEEWLSVDRGAWAGHRFDVVEAAATAGLEKEEGAKEKWRDVTGEIVAQFERLMKVALLINSLLPSTDS